MWDKDNFAYWAWLSETKMFSWSFLGFDDAFKITGKKKHILGIYYMLYVL